MNDQPNRARDSFRVVLVSVLTLLLGSGMALEFSSASVVSATASQSATNSASQTATKPVTEDPITPDPTEPTPDPVLENIAAHQTAAGCHLNAAADASASALGTCKILLVGDSIGNNLGYGMLGQLPKVASLKFSLRAKASTGLSNSWFYNWEKNLASMIRTEKPNLVIVLLGANDRQNIKVGNKVYTYGTTGWNHVYMESVGRMAKLATDSGAYVLWFGMPICKPYNYNVGMELISQLIRAEVRKNSGARFVDLHSLTSDSSGKYNQYLTVNGSRSKVRGDDGIHFTASGQRVIATYAIGKIASTFHVTLTSTSPHRVTK